MFITKKIKYKRGFTLLEVLGGLTILAIASAFLVSIVTNDLKRIKTQNNIKDEKRLLLFIKNEIKYNTKICDLLRYYNENEFIFLEKEDLLENLVNEDLFNLSKKNINKNKFIKISKIDLIEDNIKLLIESIDEKEVILSEEFEKEIWMEKV